ncbi:MAG: NUDIX domain-containing protein [Microgenomates group bacterium]
MNSLVEDELREIIRNTQSESSVRRQFEERISVGLFSRKENPVSHFCTYFPSIDLQEKKVFIGLHKKSGLWLFNGGHLDSGETPYDGVTREIDEEWGMNVKLTIPRPSLLTVTKIENPKKQICELHFDIWYFIFLQTTTFEPNPHLLSMEFSKWGWKTFDEAEYIMKDDSTHRALKVMRGTF